MNSLEEIKNMLTVGETDKAIALLDEYIKQHPDSDSAYFIRGNAYRKKESWKEALDNYSEAISINPDSPAKLAYNATIEVLDFYNKDMFNQ
jgi:tetratricopeptide (TPR) repeat protein